MTFFPWGCLSVTSSSDVFKTALYRVVLTWQLPPPSAFITSSPTITSAFLYPLLVVAFPTVLENENVLSFSTIVSFNVEQVIVILFCLLLSLVYIFVVKDAISVSTKTGSFSIFVELLSLISFFSVDELLDREVSSILKMFLLLKILYAIM